MIVAATLHPPRQRRPPVMLGLLILFLVAVVAGVSLGPIVIGPVRVLRALFDLHPDLLARIAVQDDRLPRVLIGGAAGMMLATSGLFMQTVTQNPLAAPELTGVSSGAALAAVLATTFDPAIGLSAVLPLVAIGGGLLAGAAVFGLSGQHRAARSPARLALTGVVVASVLSSGMSLVLVATNVDPDVVLQWLVGSLDLRTWSEWDLVWPVGLVLLPFVVLAAPVGNLAQLGDDVSTSLGIRARRSRGFLLGLATLLAAGAVSVVGPISFIGLIAPQIGRKVVGGDLRHLLPASALIGATIVLVADIAARSLYLRDIPLLSRLIHAGSSQGTAPVGVFLAVIGAPLFFVLVLRSERR